VLITVSGRNGVPLVGMELAEDVVQEAWIKALTAVSRFEVARACAPGLRRSHSTRRAPGDAPGAVRSHSRSGGEIRLAARDRFAENGHWKKKKKKKKK